MRALPSAFAAAVSVLLASCHSLGPTASPPANLSDVFVLPDGAAAWAVGDSGTILHTTDGGQTWRRQAVPFGQAEQSRQAAAPDLLSVQFLSDGRRGWAAGSDGVILATSDGGQSWNLELSYAGIALRAVQFLEDGRRGWVVEGTATSSPPPMAARDGSDRRAAPQPGSTPSSSSTTVCAAGRSDGMA